MRWPESDLPLASRLKNFSSQITPKGEMWQNNNSNIKYEQRNEILVEGRAMPAYSMQKD